MIDPSADTKGIFIRLCAPLFSDPCVRLKILIIEIFNLLHINREVSSTHCRHKRPG
jgi:hypothetical protein